MLNTPLKDIITAGCCDKRITTINGKVRPHFDKYKNHDRIEVNFDSPATSVKSRDEMISESAIMFRKAGLPEKQALELATKAVDNPDILEPAKAK